jgi:hypothetical protein
VKNSNHNYKKKIQAYEKSIQELNKEYNLPYYDDIRNYIVVPAPKEAWLFYSIFERIKSFFKMMSVQTKRFATKKYWSKVNIIEAISFATKISIIFPGLLFGKQWWWLYVFALVSSAALVATSTIKTLPTIIWFNVIWIILATLSIAKHFI